MTVHARQLARLCRERLAAQKELPIMRQQPAQQQAAAEKPTEKPTEAESETETKPVPETPAQASDQPVR
ncbi:hypothetical protein [Actinophytocola sp.]|jgi:hypothetical protein|uniref:hypothetical protein n=1 Tax=Actinophytocola sp. TaxID=1872138 RepID=UPI002ED7E388